MLLALLSLRVGRGFAAAAKVPRLHAGMIRAMIGIGCWQQGHLGWRFSVGGSPFSLGGGQMPGR